MIVLPSEGPESIVVSGKVASTVKDLVEGVESTFAAGSMPRTSNVCGPLASAEVGVWAAPGPLQAVKAAPSIRHSNVDPDWVAENPKVGVLSAIVLPSDGPESIVVSGGVASTVKVRLAGLGSVCAAESVARTSKVNWPSGRAEGGVWVPAGPLQAAKEPLGVVPG